MNSKTRRNIRKATVFMTIVHPNMEGTEGEEMVRYAISLAKPIIAFVPLDRAGMELPAFLREYRAINVVMGDPEDAAESVREFLELQPGQSVNITSKGYDHGGSVDAR